MPYVETVDDLAEALANMCGAYGACCEDGHGNPGHTEDKPCRVCFVIDMKDRIRDAVKNERVLEADAAGEVKS